MRKTLAALAALAAAALSIITAGPAQAAAPTNWVGPTTVQVNPGDMLINEVASSGANGALDDFGELYNPSTTNAVDISSWEIDFFNSAGSLVAFTVPDPGTSIAAGSYFVTFGPDFSRSLTVPRKAYTFQNPADTNGIVANGSACVFDNMGTVIDGVSFSSATTTPSCVTTAAGVSAGNSAQRVSDGAPTWHVATPTAGAANH